MEATQVPIHRWLIKMWRRKWQPTPVFLSGKSHGQRSLVGYSLWGRKEWDMTKPPPYISISIYIKFHIFIYIKSHMCTMDYCSFIKKNEILPFAAMWMDLENIILGELSQRKTNTVWYHLYMESKTNTTEYICKTKKVSHISLTNTELVVISREGGEQRGMVLTGTNYYV